MKPNESGRHCSSCNKTVVDFSEMNKEEIQDYFKKANGERVCGQFNSVQVEVKRPRHHLFLIELYQQIETKFTIPFVRTISLYCVLFGLFLVGCKSKTTGEPLKHNSKKDTNKHSTRGISIVQPIKGEAPLKNEDKSAVKCSVETKTEHSNKIVTVGFPEPIVVETEITDTFINGKMVSTEIIKEVKNDSLK